MQGQGQGPERIPASTGVLKLELAHSWARGGEAAWKKTKKEKRILYTRRKLSKASLSQHTVLNIPVLQLNYSLHFPVHHVGPVGETPLIAAIIMQ